MRKAVHCRAVHLSQIFGMMDQNADGLVDVADLVALHGIMGKPFLAFTKNAHSHSHANMSYEHVYDHKYMHAHA